jgi:hypothetical protein
VLCARVTRALMSVTASVCVLDVQVRGEKAITQRVPEILPADPVVTNIRGSIIMIMLECFVHAFRVR